MQIGYATFLNWRGKKSKVLQTELKIQLDTEEKYETLNFCLMHLQRCNSV